MILSDFFVYGSVLVQGHTVTFNAELVNEYFQLPNIPELEGGLEEHTFFHPYNYNLAKAFRIEDSSGGSTTKKICSTQSYIWRHYGRSWNCQPDHGSLALPLLDHAILRDGRHKHMRYRRSNTSATSASWLPNLQ
ncbi:hypothetical protein ACOSQ4_022516 [Xanthoceras sorbifolium]